MSLNNLRPAKGSRKDRKRRGRGHATGLGKTGGRGHKGQRSRSGGGVRRGFEGGQMPIQRRLPKRGFYNPFSKKIAVVNVSQLNRFDDGAEVTPELLLISGLVKKIEDGVKVLGTGEITKKLSVTAHQFSKTAASKIEAAGGTVHQA